MNTLHWHDYSYYPYERDLARREMFALLGLSNCDLSDTSIRLPRWVDTEAAERLTYFSHVNGTHGSTLTMQARLEQAARNGHSRQSTRYSVHGLHEYKGKFNPQVAKSILNIFGIARGNRVLDPFCGSGTTLVECSHIGATSVGTDINPLAAFVANAKLIALSTPTAVLRQEFSELWLRFSRLKNPQLPRDETARGAYLRAWFDEKQLAWIEALLAIIKAHCRTRGDVFLAVASNLLRDYSGQDPSDLRIRRRTSPLPELSFRNAFQAACNRFFDRLESTQLVLGTHEYPTARAIVSDIREVSKSKVGGLFDAAITSPPYATALPYIDTQRLSLVWLGLCNPEEIGPLDGALIGSREMARREQRAMMQELTLNGSKLPSQEISLCRNLAQALGPNDGFRRQAVPTLIYRYMRSMRDSFRSVSRLLRDGAPYALIVGHNHTVLSGVRFDIDTPSHLASLAQSVGWRVEEALPLQTYRRYGLHAANAVEAETLLILRNGNSKQLASNLPWWSKPCREPTGTSSN